MLISMQRTRPGGHPSHRQLKIGMKLSCGYLMIGVTCGLARVSGIIEVLGGTTSGSTLEGGAGSFVISHFLKASATAKSMNEIFFFLSPSPCTQFFLGLRM